MKSTPCKAYFGNILQKPMWDDDDFQTYFEGHFEMWEFLATPYVALKKLVDFGGELV